MDWQYLKGEGGRILVYVILALAARGGYHTVMPSPAPPAPNYPPPIYPPGPVQPPAPPAPIPVPKIDPEAAIVRIQSGNAGCTAR